MPLDCRTAIAHLHLARRAGWQSPLAGPVTNPNQIKAYDAYAFGESATSKWPVDEYGDEACSACALYGNCRCEE